MATKFEKNYGPVGNQPYFYAFLLVTLALGAFVLWPVKDVAIISLIIVLLFRPIYVFFAKLFPRAKWLATLIAVLSVLFTVLVPLTILINMTIGQFKVFYTDLNDFLQSGTSIYDLLVKLFERINYWLALIPYNEYRLSVDNLRVAIQQNLAPVANAILGVSVNVGVSIAQAFPYLIIFLFVLWYGFPDFEALIRFARQLSPLPAKLDTLYLERLSGMVRGLVRGTFTIALVQSAMATFSLWVIGMPYLLFWFVLMFVISVIPLGTSFITIPVVLVQLLLGNVWQAIFVLVIQIAVTSNLDNILRPLLIPKDVSMHPALMLLSLFGGIQLFGPIGFLYGPLIMVVMITSFEVLQMYFKTE